MNPYVWIRVVKYSEWFVLFLSLLAFGLTLYGIVSCQESATNSYCSDWGIGKTMSIRAIAFLLPMFAVLNSIHIGLDHFLNLGEQQYTNLFSVGLFGLSLSFISFTFYKVSNFILTAAQQHIVLVFVYINIGITSTIFLTNSTLWFRDSFFVKTRLLVTITYLIASTLSAPLGVLVGIGAVLACIFVTSKPYPMPIQSQK